MSLITTNLVIAGTLFLSPAHPALVRKIGSAVWFSNPKVIEAQVTGQSVTLKLKTPGLAHATGLDPQAESTTRVQAISDADYDALKRCPNSELDFSVAPPAPLKSTDAQLDILERCGFDALSIDADHAETLAPQFARADSQLLKSGVPIRGVARTLNQRALTIAGSIDKWRPQLKRTLGRLWPFYAFQQIDGPKPGRTIIFEVSLFEFSRSKATAMGVRWPRSVNFKSVETSGLPLSSGEGLEIGADFGESLGVGKVLARPSIRTKPGEKASFQSGGEIPIRNSNAYSSTTSWKNYGLMLVLEPEAKVETGAGEITVGFKLELSEPDPSTALDGVPGMRVRRLESRFDLRTEETTVLTTLIQTRSGTNGSGLPGFREIPLVEALFGRKETLAQDSELWFAVRPTWEEAL